MVQFESVLKGHGFTGCGKTRVETGLAPSGITGEVWFGQVLGRARLHSLRKNEMLHLILGGAAVYRCDN